MLIALKHSMFSLFRKRRVEDWFVYDELNVFCHISASHLSCNIKRKITDE